MKLVMVALLVACGGSQGNQPTTPANQAPPAAPPPAADNVDDKSACENRPDAFGPFSLTKEQAAARYGQSARKLTDAPTAKEKAIEVCGIPMSRTWLNGVTCANGQPGKQLGRVGSVGPGGRCGAIIDLYEVQCPETLYKVFIDIYQCGPGETLL